MRIVIQKFGGTSVETDEKRKKVIEKIIFAKDKGLSPVVVVSAMGREPAPYATDTLVKLVKEICPDFCLRDMDLLMSCGEIISAVVLSHLLRAAGQEAVALTGLQAGIFTDDHFGDANIIEVDPSRIISLLEKGIIPVVAGFQGVTKNFDVTTLGRGGSDLTATALGAALKAKYVEIYSDVDGIMTVDPKVSSLAHAIPNLTFEEAGEMVSEGARVLQRRCVALAQEYDVPVWVKCTFSENSGSLVSSRMPGDAFEKNRVATSIAHITGVTHVEVYIERKNDPAGLRTRIFNEISKARISLDLINISTGNLFFIVNDEDTPRVGNILKNLGVRYKITPGCSKLSVIGMGMRGTPGVMARIQEALYDAGVDILHSTDSHITISCLIKSDDIQKATEAIQRKFNI